MRIVIFVNDSYFAYWISQPIIKRFHSKIEVVVFSNMIKNSLYRIFRIFKEAHWRYILYRISVDMITRYNTLFNKKSVAALAHAYNLSTLLESNVNSSPQLKRLLPCDIGITVNFDQIVRGPLIKSFKYGILNFHASRLPYDRGISPVLWAFARGDRSIWGTLYQIDEGLDSGPIFKQFEIPVRTNDTAFSLYKRICEEGGNHLVALIEKFEKECIFPPTPQPEDEKENYWSWPDTNFVNKLKESDRKLILFKDIIHSVIS